MIKFLVVDRLTQAVRYGLDRGWERIAAGRYVTPRSEDVRVVERTAEVFHVSGGIKMIRGPGFNESIQAEDFEKMVEDGHAEWIDA